MSTSKQLLNLGCGNRVVKPLPGWSVVNHDRYQHRPDVNCVHDLNILPWPWADNSMDAIMARAVLEHLKLGLDESMAECWRILRPDGILTVKLPLWNTDKAHGDPTHRWSVSVMTMKYFDPATPAGKAALVYRLPPWELLQQSVIAKGSSVYCKLSPRKRVLTR